MAKQTKTIKIMGKEWTITSGILESEDKGLEGERTGYTDWSSRKIAIKAYDTPEDLENPYRLEEPDKNYQWTVRHELIHAFLAECGLGGTGWAGNEDMIDWFAAKMPEIIEAYHNAMDPRSSQLHEENYAALDYAIKQSISDGKTNIAFDYEHDQKREVSLELLIQKMQATVEESIDKFMEDSRKREIVRKIRSSALETMQKHGTLAQEQYRTEWPKGKFNIVVDHAITEEDIRKLSKETALTVLREQGDQAHDQEIDESIILHAQQHRPDCSIIIEELPNGVVKSYIPSKKTRELFKEYAGHLKRMNTIAAMVVENNGERFLNRLYELHEEAWKHRPMV